MRRIGSPKELSVVLKDKRRMKKLNQKHIAELSGMRQATISDLECDSSGAKIETLFKVATALGLDIYLTNKKTPVDNSDSELW